MGVSSERPLSDRLYVPILGNYSSIIEVSFRSLNSDWKLGFLSPHVMFTYPLVQRPSLGRSAQGGALALWKNFPLFYSLAYKPVLCESVNATSLPRAADGGDAARYGGWLQAYWVGRCGLPTSLGFRASGLKTGSKYLACCKTGQRAESLDGMLEVWYQKENRYRN